MWQRVAGTSSWLSADASWITWHFVFRGKTLWRRGEFSISYRETKNVREILHARRMPCCDTNYQKERVSEERLSEHTGVETTYSNSRFVSSCSFLFLSSYYLRVFFFHLYLHHNLIFIFWAFFYLFLFFSLLYIFSSSLPSFVFSSSLPFFSSLSYLSYSIPHSFSHPKSILFFPRSSFLSPLTSSSLPQSPTSYFPSHAPSPISVSLTHAVQMLTQWTFFQKWRPSHLPSCGFAIRRTELCTRMI